VCQRLLPYKEDTADALLRSLGLVLRLRPSAAWELAQRLATEVRAAPTRARAPACVAVPCRPGGAPRARGRLRRAPQRLRVRLRSALRPRHPRCLVLSARRPAIEVFPLSHLRLACVIHRTRLLHRSACLASARGGEPKGCPRAARAQLLALVTASAAYIRTLHGWRTVCALVTMTSLHPDAAATALAALAAVARPPALAPPSFPACLEAVMAVAERNSKVLPPTRPYPNLS